jgi:hypothetical protein
MSVVELSALGGEKCNSGSGYVVRFLANDWSLNHSEIITKSKVNEGLNKESRPKEEKTLAEMAEGNVVLESEESGPPNSCLTCFAMLQDSCFRRGRSPATPRDSGSDDRHVQRGPILDSSTPFRADKSPQRCKQLRINGYLFHYPHQHPHQSLRMCHCLPWCRLVVHSVIR